MPRCSGSCSFLTAHRSQPRSGFSSDRSHSARDQRNAAQGRRPACSTGEWEGNPSTFVWQWSLDGAPIAGATGDTYSVLGDDVDHLTGCAVTATNEFGSTTAPSAQMEIVRIAVRLLPRVRSTQPGPTIEVAGRLATELPAESGSLELLRRGDGRTVIVARTKAGKRGGFKLTETIWALVPGKCHFILRFVPNDRELYESIAVPVAVTIVSPRTYPFARSRFERRATLFDHLVPFWQDGRPCSVGCRPAGVVAGWPLRPFHEQHPLRAGINELRGSGFHLGIDIQTAGQAHVYAIQSGRAHVIQAHGGDSRVQIGHYIYWHVKLAVREAEYISAYRTAIGKVMHNVRHLHLSEVDASGGYLNPLRPAGRGLAPWEDLEPPVIGSVKGRFRWHGSCFELRPAVGRGTHGLRNSRAGAGSACVSALRRWGEPHRPAPVGTPWDRGAPKCARRLCLRSRLPVARIPLLCVPRHLRAALAVLHRGRPGAQASGTRATLPADGLRLGLGGQYDGTRSVAHAIVREARCSMRPFGSSR